MSNSATKPTSRMWANGDDNYLIDRVALSDNEVVADEHYLKCKGEYKGTHKDQVGQIRLADVCATLDRRKAGLPAMNGGLTARQVALKILALR